VNKWNLNHSQWELPTDYKQRTGQGYGFWHIGLWHNFSTSFGENNSQLQ